MKSGEQSKQRKTVRDDEKVEYNSIVPQTSGYREGQDIRAAAGDWILALPIGLAGLCPPIRRTPSEIPTFANDANYQLYWSLPVVRK